MKPDDFEQTMQRQPLRQAPPGWRREILQSASAATHPQLATLNPQPPAWWRQLLWPCPRAWAGLAAVWLVILALNFAVSEKSTPVSAGASAPPSPEMLALLREQRRLFAELVNPPELPLADRPKNVPPTPRSENRPATACA